MEAWQKGIWATVGAALLILALAVVGTWYLVTGSSVISATVQGNPFIILWEAAGILGAYMLAGALGDWPLPGRTKARRERAAQQKLEAINRARRDQP